MTTWTPLDARERRVLGVLIEKAKTTPAGYPMTINAIVTACNQKNNRDPISSYDDMDVGQSPEGERYVEFLRGGKVVAREVATVISDADAKAVVKGPAPARGGVRVDLLKGNDYVRVWINRGGNNYIIHMPPAA